MHRLVSAYVDKALLSNERTYIKKDKAEQKLEGLDFSSFVNHVLSEYKESGCQKSYNLPCFNIDVHWRPYNARCLYCDIPYNVIGRVETFEEDVQYILLKQNLTDIISLNASSLHTHKSGR